MRVSSTTAQIPSAISAARCPAFTLLIPMVITAYAGLDAPYLQWRKRHNKFSVRSPEIPADSQVKSLKQLSTAALPGLYVTSSRLPPNPCVMELPKNRISRFFRERICVISSETACQSAPSFQPAAERYSFPGIANVQGLDFSVVGSR